MLPNFSLIQANGIPYELHDFKDYVLLFVNIASGCSLKDQIRELEILYQTYQMHRFMIIGFPSNQFYQETRSNQEINIFCQNHYDVSFVINQKVMVNGADEHPVFTWLKSQRSGFLTPDIKWNFTKFLIDRDGNVVRRYRPTISPSAIAKDIEWFL